MGFLSRFLATNSRPKMPASKYPDPWSPDFSKTPIGKMEHEHYKNIEKIEATYSVLYNANLFTGAKTEQLIQLCKDDIALAPNLKEFWDHWGNTPPAYASFKRLAIIYEKQKRYDDAIAVCQEGIRLGFVVDGTKGQLYGRLAKLMRLAGRQDELQKALK